MPKSFRIAVLSIHSSPVGPLGTRDTGGMSVYVRETARWLAHAGHHVDIFTCAGEGDAEAVLYPGVRLIRIGRDRFSRMPKALMANHLEEIFDCLKTVGRQSGGAYDLVHSHYWLSGVVGEMAAKEWRCPHVIMFHTLGAAKNNAAAEENEPLGRMASERRLAQSADAVVVPTEREKENLLNHYHADSQTLYVIPCGVNADHFKPLDRFSARRTLNLSVDQDLLLYVGRFTPVKGLDILLRAVSQLVKTGNRLRLIVVGGDGPAAASTQAVRRQIRQLHLGRHVHLAGRIDASVLPCYYNAADLLVVPSRYESFGLVALEALACGTPVVATPVGAMERLLVEGENGLVVQSPDSTAVARGIAAQLALDGNKRPARESVRATVLSYGWASVARQLARLYSMVRI
jgi:D-inositol-3-phosphate glycosyltransferase